MLIKQAALTITPGFKTIEEMCDLTLFSGNNQEVTNDEFYVPLMEDRKSSIDLLKDH